MAHVNLLKQFKTGTGWVMKSIPRKSNGQRDWGALPDGSYFIEWREEGKRMRLPAGSTVSQALEAQRIKLAEIAATEVGILQRYKPLPPPPEPEPIRLSAQIRRYLDQIDTLKKPNTYRKYNAVLMRFDEHFPGRELKQISDEELNDFVIKLRKSGLSANMRGIMFRESHLKHPPILSILMPGFNLMRLETRIGIEERRCEISPKRVRESRTIALERGVPFEIEQRARRRDGLYRWFLIQYNPYRDEQGQIVRWYATGTDIDDRKRNEDRTRNENIALREEFDQSLMFEEIVGSSQSLRKVLKSVDKVAGTDSTVLILGETGTGKELIARAIHKRSTRASRAFIRVNCAAIPPELIASELFGHEKGAFTGAFERRIGRFEAADGGTLFLDEIGDLPPETQIALLRVLQEREFERVGSTKLVQVDVRVLAATNRDLAADVDEGNFRQDLFYRLNVFPVNIPPLRERIDDLPVLAEYLVDRYAKKAGKRITSIDRSTLELLRNYSWPGNVRELQNVIERAVILCEASVLYVDETWFRRQARFRAADAVPFNLAVDTNERAIIERALSACGGRVGGPNGAAARLGLPRQTLESKIKTLGINKFRFRQP